MYSRCPWFRTCVGATCAIAIRIVSQRRKALVVARRVTIIRRYTFIHFLDRFDMQWYLARSHFRQRAAYSLVRVQASGIVLVNKHPEPTLLLLAAILRVVNCAEGALAVE